MPKRPGSELVSGLLDPALWASGPHRLLAELRKSAPLAWHAEKGFWAVTRHSDIVEIESDASTFCASKGILVEEIGVSYPSPPTILHCDPPLHTRYRRLVQPGFKPSVIRALEPTVRDAASTLVEALPRNRAVDILPALAIPLPVQIIGGILGVDDSTWSRVHEWSEAVIPGATDWPEEKRQRLQGEMISYLLEATRDRRRAPRHDMLSELAKAELDGDRLSDDELAMFLVQLLVAGNETTRNLLAGGLVALAQHPEQWGRLREDRSLVADAVEEMLRWTTPVAAFLRTATRGAVVSGEKIGEGDPLLLLFVSANRDEQAFGQTASSFDVTRHPNPHLAFGFGNHFCLGAALARLEAAVVLERLLERFGSIELAGEIRRSGSSVIAGVQRAELRFG